MQPRSMFSRGHVRNSSEMGVRELASLFLDLKPFTYAGVRGPLPHAICGLQPPWARCRRAKQISLRWRVRAAGEMQACSSWERGSDCEEYLLQKVTTRRSLRCPSWPFMKGITGVETRKKLVRNIVVGEETIGE